MHHDCIHYLARSRVSTSPTLRQCKIVARNLGSQSLKHPLGESRREREGRLRANPETTSSSAGLGREGEGHSGGDGTASREGLRPLARGREGSGRFTSLAFIWPRVSGDILMLYVMALPIFWRIDLINSASIIRHTLK